MIKYTYLTTDDIRDIFISKYQKGEFRIIGNTVQQSKTIEIQNACFLADADWIIRKPNYDYFLNELDWYKSCSLNVNDIPEGAPKMWKAVADENGFINSNYGWCVFSKENGSQVDNVIDKLVNDRHTREAILIYNRPSMHTDYNKNGMHDFMCCQNMHVFLNDEQYGNQLDMIVNFRSNDAVFGYCNDYLWARWLLKHLAGKLSVKLGEHVSPGKIWWNAGSLHIYERHFDHLKKFIINE